MDKKTYTSPALKTIGFAPEKIIAGSPLNGSTESIWPGGSFETPYEDNGGVDKPW